jgi:hypothetical protein
VIFSRRINPGWLVPPAFRYGAARATLGFGGGIPLGFLETLLVLQVTAMRRRESKPGGYD